MTSLPAPILRLANIRRSYNVGTEVETKVLHGISLALQQAEFVALKGPSGSGKSTLRNIIDLLDRPTSGALDIAGRPTQSLDDAGLTNLRGAAIGFVSQFHPLLLPAFTTLENLLPPFPGRHRAAGKAVCAVRQMKALAKAKPAKKVTRGRQA